MTMTETRQQLARETAEYIVTTLIPQLAETLAGTTVTISYPDATRPPTTVAEIASALLDGRIWLSWMDDRVCTAMRALHGEP